MSNRSISTRIVSATFPVAFSGASDSGSGLKEIQLWYAYATTATWNDSGLRENGASGAFNFVPGDGDGTYFFDLVTVDLVAVGLER